MEKILDLVLPYKNIVIAIALSVALAVFVYKIHDAGYQSCEKDHAKADLAASQAALDAQTAARDKERNSTQLAADIQSGATTAIQGVYDYYEKHPNVVYRYVNSNRMPRSDSPPSSVGGVSEVAACPANNQTHPADDGHVAAGDPQEILIEPNLPARCADTTIQALECRRYVEGLGAILNGANP